MHGTPEAGDAVAGEDEDDERQAGGQRSRERERLEDSDALAQPRHQRDLDGAGKAGRNSQSCRERTPGHGPTIIRGTAGLDMIVSHH